MPIKDQDRADEGPVSPPRVNTPTVRANVPAKAAQPPAAAPSRTQGAYFLGGAWYAADATPLTAVEAQQAHRAMDAAAAAARAKALLGGER